MSVIGPLSGVRILDISQAVAGPSASQILGDMGAEVIKIESLSGEVLRGIVPKLGNNSQLSYWVLAINRNKKCITLDLYTPSGQQAFYDLVKVSDVVLDNFRSGSMGRLGADYESLRRINKKIICCSINGYGSSGPYAEFPSADVPAQAISGLAGLCGEPGGKPIMSAAATCDVGSGLYAAMAIGFALYARGCTGEGRKIEISLLDVGMSFIQNMFQHYFVTGKLPIPQGSLHTVDSTFGFHKTRDGFIGVQPSWPRIARVVNKEWMIDDPRFKDLSSRIENRDILVKELAESFAQENTDVWVELLRAADIGCGPVNTLDKVVADPQVRHNQAVIEMEHPSYGKMSAIDCPIKMPGSIQRSYSAPPLVGEHTDEILKGLLGYTDEKVQKIKKDQMDHFEQLKENHLSKLRF